MNQFSPQILRSPAVESHAQQVQEVTLSGPEVVLRRPESSAVVGATVVHKAAPDATAAYERIVANHTDTTVTPPVGPQIKGGILHK